MSSDKQIAVSCEEGKCSLNLNVSLNSRGCFQPTPVLLGKARALIAHSDTKMRVSYNYIKKQ